MTGNEARELAKRKARYGHNDWIVWKDKAGEYHAAKATQLNANSWPYARSWGHGCTVNRFKERG